MKWITYSLLLLISFNALAQTPEKMSYQAVIRDVDNNLVINSTINLKIIVREASANGESVYEETHTPNTNVNGLVSLQIGTGQINKGVFGNINWKTGIFFIESQIDPAGKGKYAVNGVSQMLSVPYAFHAKSAETISGTIAASQITGFENLITANGDRTESTFTGWDKDVSDDFSGDYNKLFNKPNLFDGDYNNLKNLPEFYTSAQVDSILASNTSVDGIAQSLNLNENDLSISGGTTISFENWDTDASDDFDGNYLSLTSLPEIYTKNEVEELITSIEGGEGIAQSLSLEGDQLQISGGNTISFENWDIDGSDDFDGQFESLLGTPEIYTKNEVEDLIASIEAGEGIVQSLSLEEDQLKISGGNTISFGNWDIDSSDDFDGDYLSLTSLPEIYTKTEVEELITSIEAGEGIARSLSLEGDQLKISGGNTISFGNWDIDSSDDFDGDYLSLTSLPEIYTKTEVEELITSIEGGEGIAQSLNLEGDQLKISGGNTISFENWDTDASDDFDGDYFSLTSLPEIYTKNEVEDLIASIEGGEGIAQSLSLEGDQLKISGGNTISFANWDTDASDDFDGNYSNLKETPEIYTKAQVDSIKAELIDSLDAIYFKKPVIVPLSSSRNIKSLDVENTVACTASATFTITSSFGEMAVGQTINIEIHGTTLTIKGASGVTINGVSGGDASLGNNEAYTGGILRKTAINTYIVL